MRFYRFYICKDSTQVGVGLAELYFNVSDGFKVTISYVQMIANLFKRYGNTWVVRIIMLIFVLNF